MKRVAGLLAVAVIALAALLAACGGDNSSDLTCRKNVCVDTPALFCLRGLDDPPDTAYMAFSVVASGAPQDASYTLGGNSSLNGAYTVASSGTREHHIRTTGRALTVEVREGSTLVRRLTLDPDDECH